MFSRQEKINKTEAEIAEVGKEIKALEAEIRNPTTNPKEKARLIKRQSKLEEKERLQMTILKGWQDDLKVLYEKMPTVNQGEAEFLSF